MPSSQSNYDDQFSEELTQNVWAALSRQPGIAYRKLHGWYKDGKSRADWEKQLFSPVPWWKFWRRHYRWSDPECEWMIETYLIDFLESRYCTPSVGASASFTLCSYVPLWLQQLPKTRVITGWIQAASTLEKQWNAKRPPLDLSAGIQHGIRQQCSILCSIENLNRKKYDSLEKLTAYFNTKKEKYERDLSEKRSTWYRRLWGVLSGSIHRVERKNNYYNRGLQFVEKLHTLSRAPSPHSIQTAVDDMKRWIKEKTTFSSPAKIHPEDILGGIGGLGVCLSFGLFDQPNQAQRAPSPLTAESIPTPIVEETPKYPWAEDAIRGLEQFIAEGLHRLRKHRWNSRTRMEQWIQSTINEYQQREAAAKESVAISFVAPETAGAVASAAAVPDLTAVTSFFSVIQQLLFELQEFFKICLEIRFKDCEALDVQCAQLLDAQRRATENYSLFKSVIGSNRNLYIRQCGTLAFIELYQEIYNLILKEIREKKDKKLNKRRGYLHLVCQHPNLMEWRSNEARIRALRLREEIPVFHEAGSKRISASAQGEVDKYHQWLIQWNLTLAERLWTTVFWTLHFTTREALRRDVEALCRQWMAEVRTEAAEKFSSFPFLVSTQERELLRDALSHGISTLKNRLNKESYLVDLSLRAFFDLQIGYDLELISNLPNNDKDQAVAGKIYLSPDGVYLVRNANGEVCSGSLVGKNINLSDLRNRLHDEDLKRSILEITSKANHTMQVDQLQTAFENAQLDPRFFEKTLELLAKKTNHDWWIRCIHVMDQNLPPDEEVRALRHIAEDASKTYRKWQLASHPDKWQGRMLQSVEGTFGRARDTLKQFKEQFQSFIQNLESDAIELRVPTASLSFTPRVTSGSNQLTLTTQQPTFVRSVLAFVSEDPSKKRERLKENLKARALEAGHALQSVNFQLWLEKTEARAEAFERVAEEQAKIIEEQKRELERLRQLEEEKWRVTENGRARSDSEEWRKEAAAIVQSFDKSPEPDEIDESAAFDLSTGAESCQADATSRIDSEKISLKAPLSIDKTKRDKEEEHILFIDKGRSTLFASQEFPVQESRSSEVVANVRSRSKSF